MTETLYYWPSREKCSAVLFPRRQQKSASWGFVLILPTWPAVDKFLSSKPAFWLILISQLCDRVDWVKFEPDMECAGDGERAGEVPQAEHSAWTQHHWTNAEASRDREGTSSWATKGWFVCVSRVILVSRGNRDKQNFIMMIDLDWSWSRILGLIVISEKTLKSWSSVAVQSLASFISTN